MSWMVQLFTGQSVAQSLAMLCLTMVLGLAIGRIRIFGVSLGVGGVLFSGIIISHLGFRVNTEILHFVREAGLILFIFMVGLQVGPGFIDSLRRRGLVLNIAAGMIVILGVLTVVVCFYSFGLSLPAAAGLLSGAVTNTPSLAAVSEVFAEIFPETINEATAEAGKAYAIAYPFGIIGIILAMLLVKYFFKIDARKELEQLAQRESREHPQLEGKTFIVSNPGIAGLTLESFLKLVPDGVVISRIKESPKRSIRAARPDVVLVKDMQLHAVGASAQLDKLMVMIGTVAEHPLPEQQGKLEIRRLLVTRSGVAGKSVRDFALSPEQGVTVTRIIRAGVEFAAGPNVHLHYGDTLICVGEVDALERASGILGNSQKELEHPHLLPIFLGILLGIVLGSIPIPVPGLPSGLKLGLAGGPMLVAILLSRTNHFAGMVWYLPLGGNLVIREAGIALFLACVGLNAGVGFVETLMSTTGLIWIISGACVTFLPLLIVAFFMRLKVGADYASICGLLSGALTDPPALAFAIETLKSDAPSSVYAGVYPLTMLLRILAAQLVILVLHYLQQA